MLSDEQTTAMNDHEFIASVRDASMNNLVFVIAVLLKLFKNSKFQFFDIIYMFPVINFTFPVFITYTFVMFIKID